MINKKIKGNVTRSPSVLAARWDFGRLFTANQAGVFYDPSDRSTLFQDAAGTVPVTAPGQPVGLILDKSRGLALGPELVINGNFSNGSTGWTVQSGWNISGGAATAINTNGYLFQTNTALALGKVYRVTYTILNYVSGTVRAGIGNLLSNSAGVSRNANGTYTEYILRSTDADATDYLGVLGTAFSGSIDDFSIREVLGIHATQATASARPTYGVIPKGGRRNLFLASEEIDDGYWNKTGAGTGTPPTVDINAAMAPNNTMTADRVNFNLNGGTTVNDNSQFGRSFNPGGLTTIFSVWLKSESGNQEIIAVMGNGQRGIITVTAEWTRYSFSAEWATMSIVGLRARGTFTANAPSILIWGMQFEISNSITPYQRVGTTVFDVTESGVQSCHYLQFDGVDDTLVTPAINFSGTNEVSLFAGVQSLGDSVIGTICELSTNSETTNGTFALLDRGNTNPGVTWRSRGSSSATIDIAREAAPRYAVYSCQAKIGTNTANMRRNGTLVANTTTAQGTGNFSNLPLYIGRRGLSASNTLNGQLFGLAARGSLSSSAEVSQSEKLLVRKLASFQDADVESYLSRVAAADGKPLPLQIQSAVVEFIAGCKADGTWSAIKAACFLAGPRTLAGALVPLVGPDPTNFNFVSGDYVPKNGLKGNGSNKRLSSGRNNTDDPQNNRHLSVWINETGTNTGTIASIGCLFSTTGSSHLGRTTTWRFVRLSSSTPFDFAAGTQTATGFTGASRSSGSSINHRINQTSGSQSVSSNTPGNSIIQVFSRTQNDGVTPLGLSPERLGWYSIGEAIDLEKLDSRLTAYMSAIAVADY